jgi:ParB family chromosome partitioning protein
MVRSKTTTPAPAAEAEQAAPVLDWADPATLVIGANIRTDADLDAGFVASIKENGVRTPIEVYRDDSGALVVVTGQRRTLGAIEAGRPLVPVLIGAAPTDVDRIVGQLDKNDNRTDMTDADRLGGYQQLELHGLSGTAIAKRLGRKAPEVRAALKVAKNPMVAEVAADYGIDLVTAAKIADFTADVEIAERLAGAARRGVFDHELQRQRDERAERDAITAAEAELTAAGVALALSPRPQTWKALGMLATAEGTELTEEEHRACPGHAAYVARAYDGPNTVYGCLDWTANGHQDRYPSTAATATAKPKDKAAASAERRDVIASNKAWRSAERVRRTWLVGFVSAKKAPATAAPFIAAALAHRDDALGKARTNGNPMAHYLLGLTPEPQRSTYMSNALVEMLDKATPDRAGMIGLALVLGAHEGYLSGSEWRSPTKSGTRYLRYLAAHGYTLSDVERRACGETIQAAADAVEIDPAELAELDEAAALAELAEEAELSQRLDDYTDPVDDDQDDDDQHDGN